MWVVKFTVLDVLYCTRLNSHKLSASIVTNGAFVVKSYKMT